MLTGGQKILLFLFIFFLPSQLALHFWPGWSIVHGARVDYLSPAVYLTDILLLILVIKGIDNLNVMDYHRLHQGKFPAGLISIILFIILNLMFSYQPLLTFYWYFKILLLTLFAVIYSKKTGFTEFVLVVLPYSLIYVIILAFWQFSLRHSVGGLWYFLGERPLSLSMSGVAKVSFLGQLGGLGILLRPYSTFPHPNSLAGFLLVCYFIFLRYKPQSKFLLTIISAALLLTFSRSAIFIYLLLNIIYFLKRKFVFLTPLLFLPFLLPGNPQSFSERIRLLPSALNLIKLHPITGVGLGCYLLASSDYLSQPVHNLYVLLIAELGLPLVFFIAVFIRQIISIPVIAILLTGLTDHYWLTSHQNFFLVFLLLALVYNHTHVRSDKNIY